MLKRTALAALGFITALTLAPAPSVRAQEPPTLTFGRIDHVQSKGLGEDRRINVFVPPGYHKGTARFPVIYLLDGSAHEDYFHVASLIDFLATYGVMPDTIVVGISNVDRKRDFTLPSKDEKDLASAPTSGGAGRFVSFLETELVPYVEAHYRTAGTRTIIGQSLGGLLATQILLEKPALFDNYVIVSPSLWWNHEALIQASAELMKKNQAPNRKVYLSIAEEHPEMMATARTLGERLKECRWEGLQSLYDFLGNENHATSLHISVYRAMAFLYQKPKS